MNRISKLLLSLSLLISCYTLQSHPYWPEERDFGHLLAQDVELAIKRIAQNNIQSRSPYQPYQREMKATYRVGETISIVTPYDARGEFCQWRFLFGGRLASYEEGIQKLQQSGLIRFTGTYVDDRMCIEVWSTDFPCDSVNQMTINFTALRPGKIIFYMKNKEYYNQYMHGCSCKPTVTKFEIEIVDNYNSTYYMQ
jgi:N-acetylmuramoyl-L-alanine amidase CwlA